MRDRNDNVVIVCSIENLDPMGVHTGDSITVAPAQTLTDKEYQRMRDASIAVIARSASRPAARTSSSPSIPKTANGRDRDESARQRARPGEQGDRLPIAKIAAKLAVGYTLDEIAQRHHPRDAGLLRADHRLLRDQDSALHVREISRGRPDAHHADEIGRRDDGHRPHLQGGAAEGAARAGIVDFERTITITVLKKSADEQKAFFKQAKGMGFSDAQLATLLKTDELSIRNLRKKIGVIPTYKLVDTCAAEFEAYTPYYYSTYEEEDESAPSNEGKLLF
jgi:carbamoyl-phosphate synthase large subunit